MQSAVGTPPLFSVVVTTYNRPTLLERAIASLRDQSLQDFEVVVVNDHGEPVENLVRRFDLPIAYACPADNIGLPAARNLALRLCRGTFIAYLDDDDVLLPEHLAVHARAHADHPDTVVFTDTRYVRGEMGGPTIGREADSEQGFSHDHLLVRNFIPVNNWTHPRVALEQVGSFDPNLTALEDWDLLLRLANHYPFEHVQQVTSEVWLHGSDDERMTSRQQKNFPTLYRKLYQRYDKGCSNVVLNDRRRLLEQLDAGADEQIDDYPTVVARWQVSTATAAFAQRVATVDAATLAQVVVTDRRGDRAAVQRTLVSLDQQHLKPCRIVVRDATAADQAHWAHRSPAPRTGDRPAPTKADWVLLLDAGDTLAPLALLLLAERFANHPAVQCCYMDEDCLIDEVPDAPVFKPDFNLDLLRSYPYIGSALAIRLDDATAESVTIAAGPLEHLAVLFDRLERYGAQSIAHVAEVVLHAGMPFAQWLSQPEIATQWASLASSHLTRLGILHEMLPGALPIINRVRYLHRDQPLVSVIIPTRNHLASLNGLIDSLLAKTNYRHYELVIVDNDSDDPATCAYLDGIERLDSPQLRILRWPRPFNYSAINNFAVAQAAGEYVLLLNDDTAVIDDVWMEALLNHAQRAEVGAVGAKLCYPDGRVQHAGIVLGLAGAAGLPCTGMEANAPGYMHRLLVDQDYSAVSASCIMIRKAIYTQVGGLDEGDLRDIYNDVDLCLKIRAAGYLVVWTPYARLMHEGAASLNRADKVSPGARAESLKAGQAAMYRKWLPQLAADPAYNHNLGVTGNGFDLGQIRPRAWQPFDKPLLPRLFCVAADNQGCGHYRIRQPFATMQREGLAEGMIGRFHLNPVLMERMEWSSIVLQRQITEGQIRALRQYRDYTQAFKVYELDDYMPNLPLKSVHRKDMPKDIMKSLRQAVALTDRFVVSTAPLAEAFADLHSDIRVVPNRLPVHWWAELRGAHRHGTKPRVGWAGGSSHRGDLELIADVVRELKDEVDFIFLGMCPETLQPHAAELHDGIAIDDYPTKLAALDLDLALAPLEDNLFNACKSNLRLLEYGACGFPVVCSDNICYRGDLPVTRVKNRFKDWVDAIRMHTHDMDAAAKAGDALREAVHRDWMLSGDNLRTWRDAWLPD